MTLVACITDDVFASYCEAASATEPEANFSTECWFLTIYCHHIALIPVLNKYHRRLRAIRDLQKMVSSNLEFKDGSIFVLGVLGGIISN